MLAREPPFDPLLERMASDERPPVREAAPVLKEVLEQCWAKDPKRRPTAGEICVKFAEVGRLLVRGAGGQGVRDGITVGRDSDERRVGDGTGGEGAREREAEGGAEALAGGARALAWC
jgi:hypothetical protein